MSDDRYRNITDPAQRAFVTDEIRRYLLAATERACESLSCTGVSFVLMGVRYWLTELAEIDARQAARYFRALADWIDPDSPPRRVELAVKRQKKAFLALCGGVNK